MTRVHIGLEPIDDEPDERPDRLGKALLEIRDNPERHGRWWAVATASDSWVRAAVRRLSGKVDPPGVPGMRDLDGWEARAAQTDAGWQLRVRYTAPTQEPLPLTGVVDSPGLLGELPGESSVEKAGALMDRIANRASEHGGGTR